MLAKRNDWGGWGRGTIDVITAQQSLIRARDADIGARYATVVARVSLARAAGIASTLH